MFPFRPFVLLAILALPARASAQDCLTGGSTALFADGFEGAASNNAAWIDAGLANTASWINADLPGLSPLPVTTLNIPVTPPLQIPVALTPTIRAQADGSWQAAATWGGRVPRNCDIVEIPRGRTVSLIGNTAHLNGLWVDGALEFADGEIKLSSRFIVVSGRLQAGTESEPYRHSALISLFGSDPTLSVLGMGTKVIAVVGGGLLKLHGEQRLAWTRLAQTVNPGMTSITTADAPAGWRVGDQILLVASGYDPREAETLTITGVGNNQISFSPALRFAHVGMVQSYGGKTLDQRAAVALLSRNLKIRGADDSIANAFGGHVMSMAGGHAQISGVEFQQMGQRGRFGRYPMHWHIAGDRAGNYLIASTINRSFQRAAVIHSTHNVLLDANIAYDISNHAFVWAEDGDEFGNQLTRNVGALIRSPAPQHFAFPINNPFHGNNSQDEHRSSVFWGRSFDRMVLTGNISAGALDGFGYFFDLFSPAPFGADEGAGLVFDGNTAHSTYKTLATGNQINYPESTTGHGLMVSTGSSGLRDHVFRNYTGFHNVSGAWLEDRRMQLRDSILADNGVGLMVLRSLIDGNVIVGESANPIPAQPTTPSVSTNLTAGIQVAGSNHGGKRAPIVRNTTLINQSGTGILWDLDNMSPAAQFENLSFINTPQRIVIHDPINFEFAEPPTFGLSDPDGSLFGNGQPTRLLRQDAHLITPACVGSDASNAYACPRAASLLLRSPIALNLTDSSGAITYLRQFDYADAGMPADGAVSFVGNGLVYDVSTSARSRYDFSIGDAQNKSLELVLAVSGAPTRVMQSASNLGPAASLSALRSASASAYFHDSTNGRLHARFVGTAPNHELIMEAPFVTRVARGREAIPLPAAAPPGFAHRAVQRGFLAPQLRYPVPTGAALREGNSDAALLDHTSSGVVLNPAQNGVATSMSFYVQAPVPGTYRIGLWGNGGGTSVWIGGHHVMGESWAFINSNWVSNGQLTTQVVAFQVNGLVALNAGWHKVDVVHGKFPQNNQGRNLYFRWATPSAPGTWVYPSLRRDP